MNGDGFADVIVGAPLYDLEGAGVDNGGAAFAFYGTPNGLPLHPEWSVGGDVKGSRYGSSVASAGDVNGDGYDDVIIGAYRYKNGELDSEEGAAFLYYGSEDGLSPAAGWQVESDQPYAQLGYAVAGAGDLNADGFDDLAVGARWYMVDEDNEGAVFVFYGSKDGPSLQPDLILEGDQTGATFGSALGSAGDVNGDGCDDLVVGAPDFDYEEADAGAVFVFTVRRMGCVKTGTGGRSATKPEAWFGVSTGTAGDVNGDGYADVVVGAPGYEYEPASLGSVFVYHGSKDGLSETESWRANSGQSSAWFGSLGEQPPGMWTKMVMTT